MRDAIATPVKKEQRIAIAPTSRASGQSAGLEASILYFDAAHGVLHAWIGPAPDPHRAGGMAGPRE